MGILLFANNAITTLAAGISSGATTANVATGSGALFPSPSGGDYFVLTLRSASNPSGPKEIVYCTARSGDTVTITRAQEGTAAQAWLAGDIIGNFFTAGQMAALYSLQDPSNIVASIGLVGNMVWSAYDEADGALKLVCDGRSLARAGTYARLFAAIDTVWGAVDGTHFNLPDGRGRYLQGAQGGGVPAHDGLNVGAYAADQMQGFAIPAYAGSAGGTSAIPLFGDRQGPVTNVSPVTDGTHGAPSLGYTTRPLTAAAKLMIYY